jgi:hypothetical protein
MTTYVLRLFTLCALYGVLAGVLFSCPCAVLASDQSLSLDDALGGFTETAPDTGPTSEATALDGVLEGFGNAGPAAGETDPAALEPEIVTFSGEFSFFTSVNLDGHLEPDKGDYRGISHLRTGLDLDMDVEPDQPWQIHAGIRAFYDPIFSLKDRADFTQEYLDQNEADLELHEAFILATPLDSVDVKVGRQIVAWGTSEALRVVDVLNPMDRREPGQTDIEDLRLPVFMTRADYFPDTTWSLSAVVVNETRFDKDPEYGSDYFPGNHPLPEDTLDSFDLDNQEFAFSATGRFTGWDVSLHSAWVLDDTPYFCDGEREHARITMFGATTQFTFGNWLVKAESAVLSGLRYTVAPDMHFTRVDMLGGLEYSGFEETTLTLELLNRHIVGYDNILENGSNNTRQDEPAVSMRAAKDMYNDTLHLLGVMTLHRPFDDGGGMGRLEASYDVDDAWTVRSGYAYYLGGSVPYMEAIESNDRIFGEITYSF